jgi:ribonuclease VapC
VAERYVLDSYALLALLSKEAGSEKVAALLERAQVGKVKVLTSWANVGEVAAIVERRRGRVQLHQVLELLTAAEIEIVPVGRDLTVEAAHLKTAHPLPYADALAAALAIQCEATLVTGDPEFEPLAQQIRIQWLVEPPSPSVT